MTDKFEMLQKAARYARNIDETIGYHTEIILEIKSIKIRMIKYDKNKKELIRGSRWVNYIELEYTKVNPIIEKIKKMSEDLTIALKVQEDRKKEKQYEF